METVHWRIDTKGPCCCLAMLLGMGLEMGWNGDPEAFRARSGFCFF